MSDNLPVRVHVIIVMVRWTGHAQVPHVHLRFERLDDRLDRLEVLNLLLNLPGVGCGVWGVGCRV